MDKMTANIELAKISLESYEDRAENRSITLAYRLRGRNIHKVLGKLDNAQKLIVTWVCVDNDIDQCEHILRERNTLEQYAKDGVKFDVRSEIMTVKDARADSYIKYANHIHVM